MPTCRCCGWTSSPAADTTAHSPCTDTGRCRGWGVGSWDTRRRTRSRTAPRPTAGRWGTTSPRLDLHTGTHLGGERVYRKPKSKLESDMALCTSDCGRVLACYSRYLQPYFQKVAPYLCLFSLAGSCLLAFRMTDLLWCIYGTFETKARDTVAIEKLELLVPHMLLFRFLTSFWVTTAIVSHLLCPKNRSVFSHCSALKRYFSNCLFKSPPQYPVSSD